MPIENSEKEAEFFFFDTAGHPLYKSIVGDAVRKFCELVLMLLNIFSIRTHILLCCSTILQASQALPHCRESMTNLRRQMEEKIFQV